MKSALTRITLSSILLVSFIPTLSSAEIKTFVKEYTYQASEADSKLTSRAIALEQAKRLVLEELGTYLMSRTEVKDLSLKSDRIVVLTAGVVQTEIFDEKWDGQKYYLKAMIKADPVEVVRAIDKIRKDEGKTTELEDAKKRADDALKEIEKLKADLNLLNVDRSKQLEYANRVNGLSADDLLVSGIAYFESGNYQEALYNFDRAIRIKQDFANAYNGRGAVYNALGSYQRALTDFNKAIELKPDLAAAYTNRAFSDNELGNYYRGIEDATKAIELNPNLATAYNNRGLAYKSIGDFRHSIQDYSKAIELRPDEALYWASRGYINYKLGNTRQQIEDYKIAARLGNRDAQTNLTNMGIGW